MTIVESVRRGRHLVLLMRPKLGRVLPLPTGILYSPQFRSHQETKMAARRTRTTRRSTCTISRKNRRLWTVYVAIGSGIFQFTQAQVNVFVLTAFEYSYLAFTSLVIVVELCSLLCYEAIVLKFRWRVSIFVWFLSAILFVRAQSRSCQSF